MVSEKLPKYLGYQRAKRRSLGIELKDRVSLGDRALGQRVPLRQQQQRRDEHGAREQRENAVPTPFLFHKSRKRSAENRADSAPAVDETRGRGRAFLGPEINRGRPADE